MPKEPGIKGQTIIKYLTENPETPTTTLSRIIYKDNPSLFKDSETVRGLIRCYRGARGDKIYAKGKFNRKVEKPFSFPKLPEGITSLNDWHLVKITGDYKTLLLGDIHIPYHSKSAVEIAVKEGQRRKVDMIFLNGDIADIFSLSKWEKDPRQRQFPAELKTCIQFLEWLRYKFPKARIIFKKGNHEERYESYMHLKAKELLGVKEFEFESVFELDRLGIGCIGDKKPIKLNELVVIHGHEYKFAISNPVNPARGLYLKSKVNTVTHHFHQSSQHSEKNIEDKVTSCWSLGCLSELHPEYMPLNKWNHGFAIVETMGDKLFNVYSYKIIDNKIYSE